VRPLGPLVLQGRCDKVITGNAVNCTPCHLQFIDPTIDRFLASLMLCSVVSYISSHQRLRCSHAASATWASAPTATDYGTRRRLVLVQPANPLPPSSPSNHPLFRKTPTTLPILPTPSPPILNPTAPAPPPVPVPYTLPTLDNELDGVSIHTLTRHQGQEARLRITDAAGTAEDISSRAVQWRLALEAAARSGVV
jgi:hypothetical protein